MLSSLIGNLVGKSFAKVLASFSSPKSSSQNTSSSQKPNSEFAKEKVSKLQALENKISSAYCEGSDFVKGFSEGINPLTPLTDFARNVFKSPPEHCGNGTSFNSGKITGAKTGLLVDTFLAADGTVKASGGVACSALSSGGCAPVATPAIAVGASEVVAGAAMGVGHASNYMLASQKKEEINNKVWRKVEDDHKYIPAYKGNELPGFPGTKKTPRKTPVEGGGGFRKRWKDVKGIIYEWDYKKGTVEKYSKNGKIHLGEFNPYTGKAVGPAKPERWVEK